MKKIIAIFRKKASIKKEEYGRNNTLKWMAEHRDFTEMIEGEFSFYLQRWLSKRELHPDVRISTLSDFVDYMNGAKKLCEKKGKDYLNWLETYLLKDNYLERRQAELDNLKKNYDRICKSYNTRKNISPNIDEDLIAIIKRKPGILQTELYKEFGEDMKSYISNRLGKLDKDGKIKREKNGNTYSLKV